MNHENLVKSQSRPPLVSIGIPVYNGERFLAESLDSIRSQRYHNLEIIIVDNASTDGTPFIIDRYAEADPRFMVYRNETNLGAAANYNLAFRYAHGTYFKWASCDDLIDPDFIARCVKVLERDRSAVLCYPKTVLISESGETIGIYEDRCNLDEGSEFRRFRHFLRTCRLCNSIFGVVRADALSRTPLIEPYVASDFVLLARLALFGTFIELHEPLFFRREHSANVRKLPAAECVKWFSPTGRLYRHPELHKFFKLIAVSVHSHLSISKKAGCIGAVVEWGLFRIWNSQGRMRRRLSAKKPDSSAPRELSMMSPAGGRKAPASVQNEKSS